MGSTHSDWGVSPIPLSPGTRIVWCVSEWESVDIPHDCPGAFSRQAVVRNPRSPVGAAGGVLRNANRQGPVGEYMLHCIR